MADVIAKNSPIAVVSTKHLMNRKWTPIDIKWRLS